MFIHVPSAWLSMAGYALMASPRSARWSGGIRSPTWPPRRRRRSARPSRSGLVTGSLWGRPMWGTYWVWDARLTSVLVLFLMYLGVIALWRTVDDPARAARAPRS
jgi:heme exporter protein C